MTKPELVAHLRQEHHIDVPEADVMLDWLALYHSEKHEEEDRHAERRVAWQARYGAQWEAATGLPSPMRADAADRKVSWWLLQLRYHDDYEFRAGHRTPLLLNEGTAYAEPFTVTLALSWARRIAEVELA